MNREVTILPTNSSQFHNAAERNYNEEYKKLVSYLEAELAKELKDSQKKQTPKPKKFSLRDSSSKRSKSEVAAAATTSQMTTNDTMLKSLLNQVVLLDIKSDSKDETNVKKLKQIALHLNNLAFSFNRLGQHQKAIECYIKSLEIKEKLVTIQSTKRAKSTPNRRLEPDVASNLALSYNNVGATYSYMNDEKSIEKSIDYYRKSLDISIKLPSETPNSSVNVANQYNNIGLALNRLGRHDIALEKHKEALRRRQLLFAEKGLSRSDDIADTLNNIANCYFQMNKLRESVEYHEKALQMRLEMEADEATTPNLEMRQKTLIDVASSHFNLGILKYHLNEFNKSLEHFQQAINYRNQLVPSSSPSVFDYGADLDCLNYMGNIHYKLGRYQMAIELFRQELEIFNNQLQRKIGPDSTTYLMANKAGCLNNIGAAYASLGEYKEALEYLNESLKMRKFLIKNRSTISDNSKLRPGFFEQNLELDLANSLNNLGVVDFNLGDYSNSINNFEHALELIEDLVRNQTKSIVVNAALCSQKSKSLDINLLNIKSENICKNIANCYLNRLDFVRSIEYFERALDYNAVNSANNKSSRSDDEFQYNRRIYLNFIEVCKRNSTSNVNSTSVMNKSQIQV